MSTRTAALPIERRYLFRVWIVVSATVIAATVLVAIALAAGRAEPAGSSLRTDVTGRIADYGPTTTRPGPIVLHDGTICAQCR